MTTDGNLRAIRRKQKPNAKFGIKGYLDLTTPIKRGWLSKSTIIEHRFLDRDGYVHIKVRNHPIVGTKLVREHRLVLMEKLGRILKDQEIVHHRGRNPDKAWNAPSRLLLTNQSRHIKLHQKELTAATIAVCKGRPQTPERKAHQSRVMKGNQHLLGHKHSKKTKAKLAAAGLRRVRDASGRWT